MKQKRLMTPDIKREKSLRFTPVFQKYFDEKPENLKDPKMIEMNSFEVINQSPSPPKISDDIMQLKAERLEVYRDLYDYEHLYDSKNSMRVRLLQTLEQSKEVFKVISEIQKQIDTEKELLALINTELKPADISQKSKRKYKSKVVIGWLDLYITENIDSVYCFIEIKIHKSSYKIQINVHPSNYNKTLSISLKPIKELEIYIKQAGKYLMLGISRLVIPHLHFVWKTDVLSVDFNPKTNTKTSFSIIESLNMPSLPTIQIKTSKSLNLNEFDISLGTSNQLFSNFDIGFELFYNTVLSTLGISITFGNLDYTYSSLDFPDEFELLKNLQFSYIPDCRKTVLKSLEIRLVIKKLLNF